MKRLLGMNSDAVRGVDELQTLEIMKKTGFDCFFTGASKNERVKELKAKADELGLCFEFIHAPFFGINAMWEEGDGYLKIYNNMTEAIDSAAANGVRTVIVHTSSSWTPPFLSDIGFQRFDKLVAYAKEKGVIVAFENLRSLCHITCFVDRYKDVEHVRFCYDFGHEHCYTKHIQWMDMFAEKLICTHIHDNHGYQNPPADGDEHLLPFDGTIDYKKCVGKLDEYGYQGSLMLEVSSVAKEEYKQRTAEEFIQTAFDRVKKISQL